MGSDPDNLAGHGNPQSGDAVSTRAPDIVLLSTYEMGRQPFGLASPAAWLREEGATVDLQDLAICALDPEPLRTARMVGIYVPMHTATRLAGDLIGKVRSINPDTHIVCFGLYAPLNASHLQGRGADTVIGGEFESALTDLWRRVAAGAPADDPPVVSTARLRFKVPERRGLPDLDRYARLRVGPEEDRVTGYTEASRGCRHRCRHCPIVPVYDGAFRIVPPEVVIADVAAQVQAGARHITFGDPDFLNGPAHSVRIVEAMAEHFPDVTYDVTVKVEHILRHADLLPILAGTGCSLVTSAFEAFDDGILERLDKGHTAADAERAVALTAASGLALNPTFVAFTPWTTREGYLHFLDEIARLGLAESVSPIQYAIRLLIPAGSLLLDLPDVADLAGGFDDGALAHPWAHPDPGVDALQQRVMGIVRSGEQSPRHEVFARVWEAAADTAGSEEAVPGDGAPDPATVPYLTEPWYC
jgi:radical SAM superfamily enzyme YgiQ (UPF0313 family)